MISKKQIELERGGLDSLRNLVEAYQEIAAGRIQKVRGAVLQSRLFMQGLVDVFTKVRAAYVKTSAAQTSVRKLNGRTVAVFVSANAGLYGDIVERTFTKFSEYVLQTHSDVVVLGKLGMVLMGEHMPSVLFNYFDFSDDGVDLTSFDVIMRYLIQFEKIVVFHGLFKTILSQDPVQTLVSGESLEKQIGIRETTGRDYMFEPNVEEVAKVFEGEILSSIFEQSLHEAVLSKQASRMLSLDRSLESIDKRLGLVKVEEKRIQHRLRSRKQLNTMAGSVLWG